MSRHLPSGLKKDKTKIKIKTISQIQKSQRSVPTSAFWPQPSWQAMSLTCPPSPPEGEEVSSKYIVIFMHISNHYQAYNIMNILIRIMHTCNISLEIFEQCEYKKKTPRPPIVSRNWPVSSERKN